MKLTNGRDNIFVDILKNYFFLSIDFIYYKTAVFIIFIKLLTQDRTLCAKHK